MRLVLRLGVMIVGAVLGGVLARVLASDLTLVGMVIGAGAGWFLTGEQLMGWLRRDRKA